MFSFVLWIISNNKYFIVLDFFSSLLQFSSNFGDSWLSSDIQEDNTNTHNLSVHGVGMSRNKLYFKELSRIS